MTQGAGDAPGQEEGCLWPSLAGEPRSYVGAELGDEDVPPPSTTEEPRRSPSLLTAVKNKAYIFTEVSGNTAEKQTAFPSPFFCFFFFSLVFLLQHLKSPGASPSLGTLPQLLC